MLKRIKNKNAFTLIELIITIAVLGVLVLLAAPKFSGHLQNAELTKGLADSKSIQKASEQYFMDNEDWPRLTDDPYTSEEIKTYSEHIYDTTGEEVNLDPNGNYYNIDYNKLKEYIKVPSNKEDYILQNPVGKIFYMDNLNESGSNRVDYTSNKQANLRTPSKPIVTKETEDSYIVTGESGSEVKLNDGEWKNSPHLFEDLNDGETYSAYSRFKSTENYSASKVSEVAEFEVEVALPEPVSFSYSGSSQEFLVPKTGTYKLEVWGAQGGRGKNSIGGRGGYSLGTITLNKDQPIKIYVGGMGATTNNGNGGWNGGGGNYTASGGSTGGGATDIRLNGTSLTNRIIVAGAGSGGAWDGLNGAASGGLIGESGKSWNGFAAGLGGTQSSGGTYSGKSTGGSSQKQSITSGVLGQGGRGSGSGDGGSGGGGGYYGGGGGLISPGGGGSSYIGGVQNGQTIAGSQSMPNPNGGTMVGNSGNGFARITRVN